MKLLAQFVRRVSVPLLAGTLLASAAWAQKDEKFPNRTIKIIVPLTPGGTTDVMARAIGQKLNDYWGQPVIVENKPGAAGWLGITAMAKSPADGYTIGVTISSIIYAKSLYTKLPFDIANDFEAVSMLSRSAIGLVVPAQFPADNLQDFIAQLDTLNRALMLLYLEDHSYREIADIVGISETNVATKISRLKQRIRDDINTHS